MNQNINNSGLSRNILKYMDVLINLGEMEKLEKEEKKSKEIDSENTEETS